MGKLCKALGKSSRKMSKDNGNVLHLSLSVIFKSHDNNQTLLRSKPPPPLSGQHKISLRTHQEDDNVYF